MSSIDLMNDYWLHLDVFQYFESTKWDYLASCYSCCWVVIFVHFFWHSFTMYSMLALSLKWFADSWMLELEACTILNNSLAILRHPVVITDKSEPVYVLQSAVIMTEIRELCLFSCCFFWIRLSDTDSKLIWLTFFTEELGCWASKLGSYIMLGKDSTSRLQ